MAEEQGTRRRSGSDGLGGELADVVATVKAYALQETVDPLRGVGRFLAFGIAGGVLIAIGAVLVVLALLRFLQTRDVSAFHGTWSFVPYLITLVPCLAGIALALSRIGKTGLDSPKDQR